MRVRIGLPPLLSFLCLATACSSSDDQASAGEVGLAEGARLRIAGDSTAAIFPETDETHRVGWGAVLQEFFTDALTVVDSARSGRSSKSFIDEGYWGAITMQLKAGDFVFIQFGHNDEKAEDPARYTDPATTFRDYLRIYIDETRDAGANPVLLTPIERRKFSGTTVSPTHGAYPAAMLEVADETATPLIDMTAKTNAWLEALGPEASVEYFADADNTHLSAAGAHEVAGLVVEGIEELELPLVEALASE